MPLKKTFKISSLVAMFDRVNFEHLGGLCCAGIQWKKLPTKPGNVILGTASFETRIISINKILQDPEIPEFVLEATALHEMLHLLYTPDQAMADGFTGRDMAHSDRFKSIELRYKVIDRSKIWEENNLDDFAEIYMQKHPSNKDR